MMPYDSQFVLCVLHNGSPVREIDRTVHLPFHSEYKIRLKNKHSSLRAKARVWVDGRQVSNLGDFILQPNETLDLERFLDHSMTEGNKFKFVPLSDGKVNDPTDPENGIIKVEFYRERSAIPLGSWNITRKAKPSPWRGDGGSAGSPGCFPTYNSSQTFCSTKISSSYAPVYDSCYLVGDAGATVEGGHSDQSFVYGSDFMTEFLPVTLELRIKGLAKQPIPIDWDDSPVSQRRPKKRIRFCPNCGAKRHGMAKFCSRCGTAYHPRYERERGRISPK